MARPPRLEIADGIYHAVARGNERKRIFRDDRDRITFLETLTQVLDRFGWRCLAYCLMDNHFHLLVRTPVPNLSLGMRQLNGVYAQRFNRRHSRVGHLFQGRYGAVLVEADSHLLEAARYVVRNPVRAGLCSEPGGWRWSSYRATLGLEPPGPLVVDELLANFSLNRQQARALYRDFVSHQDGRSPRGEDVVYGSASFASVYRQSLPNGPEVPRRYSRDLRPSLAELLSGRERGAAIALAYRKHGYRLHEIASALDCHYSTVSRRLLAHERRVLQCKTWPP